MPHAPDALQVSTPLPEHWVAPGVPLPVHAPDTHAWLVHDTAVPQVPVGLHVCTPLPEQRVAPGKHTPVHDPIEHA